MKSEFDLHPVVRARGIMVIEDSHLQRRAAVEVDRRANCAIDVVGLFFAGDDLEADARLAEALDALARLITAKFGES